jgi:cyclic pyranopterin phosphate synthase
MSELLDSFRRRINYLRISVTDRCNLRCIYCMPSEGVPWIPHGAILSYEEISTIVQVAAGMGINKVRLTGGEPLLRAELPKLIEMLSQIKGIEEISLTTNGTLLKRYAMELKQAGLKRVNISLDTLKSDRFRYITRCGELRDALDGIDAAMDADLQPIKINMVVMRGINDDEVLDFARMSYNQGWNVRFIEVMPFIEMAESVPSSELRQRIMSLGPLLKAESCQQSAISSDGPARYYRLPGARGTIGFISPISEPFCSDCNRLRLTSNGRLCPCLLSDDGVDLKQPLRSNASPEEIKRLILKVVASKPERHRLSGGGAISMKRKMSQTGG